jgi:hypothetical protein
MKSGFTRPAFTAAALFLAVASFNLHAQTGAAAPVNVKVCDVLKDPASFDGKTVSIQATVVSGLEEFLIEDEAQRDCGLKVNAIWLSYPKGTNAVSGPVVMLQMQAAKNFSGTPAVKRDQVKLEKNKDWKQFDSILSEPYKGHGLCLGCARNAAAATLTGRIDAAKSAVMQRDSAGKIVSMGGFGNLNAYPVRMVLEEVSNPTAAPVDYSKIADDVKHDSEPATAAGDPRSSLGDATSAAGTFSKNSPNAALITRAVSAFGDKDNYSGIEINNGNDNEADIYAGQSRHDSPDGVVYYVTVDPNRLRGKEMGYAMVHLGSHIADMRGQQPPSGPISVFATESNAWLTDAFYALGKNQDNIVLPGGYLLWSLNWPTPERTNRMSGGILRYLLIENRLKP